jgi:hypothetical protein
VEPSYLVNWHGYCFYNSMEANEQNNGRRKTVKISSIYFVHNESSAARQAFLLLVKNGEFVIILQEMEDHVSKCGRNLTLDKITYKTNE